MTILAIDGSTKSTGWSIFCDGKLIDYGCITANSTDKIKRIQKMGTEIANIINQNPSIEHIVMEEVIPKSGNYDTPKNKNTQRALMWLQAATAFIIHEINPKIEFTYVYPSEWRKKCKIKQGAGIQRETLKDRDIAFVEKNYNLTVNDDIADAICIGHSFFIEEESEKKPTKLYWGQ